MKIGLFKKRDENKETVQNVQPITVNPYQDQMKTLIDTVSNLSKSIKNVEGKIYELSEKITGVEEKTKLYESEVNNIKSLLDKMIGIYDLLYKQYNPFLEEEKKEEEKTNIEIKTISEETKADGILPLDKIENDPTFIAIIIGWLNYLVRKGGIKETEKALEFYERINWITEDVKIRLLEYLKGFENVESKNEGIKPEDHLLTLYIISKLKSREYGKTYRIKDLYNELVNKGIIKPNEL